MAQFSQKEMDQLRTQMYSGFVTKSVPRYEWRGAGRDGRARRQTGYKQVTNYDAYNDGLLGRARDAAGIKNVNSDDEIRRIYDFIGGYKPPAPAAPAPKAAAPAPKPISNPYKEQSSALLKTIDSLVQSMDKPAPAPPPPPKTIFAGSTNVNSPGNLQIAPAAGINKRGGTNNFKRRTQAAPTNTLRTIQSVNV